MLARIRGTEIFFDVESSCLVDDGARISERPTAFLVHGGPGVDHVSLKARTVSLAKKLQLVYFDHRGQGRSAPCSREGYSLDENVEDMEALRKHLGLGPVVSLGTSYGGMVALAHAARYPDAVSQLILVASVAHAGYAARARQIVAERGTTEQIAMCSNLFEGRVDTRDKMLQYFDVMGPLYSRRHDPQAFRQAMQKSILTPQALNRAHGPDGFLRTFDLRNELPAVRARTLLIAGRHDWICAPEFSEEILGLIPDCELRVFEDSAHSVASDEPERFQDVIAGFIAYPAQRSSTRKLHS